MSDDLTQKKCKPCEGGIQPLTADQAGNYASQVDQWAVGEAAKNIRKKFVMKNFLAAVSLIQKIAEIAEAEDHHPDIHLTGYRLLVIELSTHAIGGLCENDFILAAKIDQLPKELKV